MFKRVGLDAVANDNLVRRHSKAGAGAAAAR